MDQINQMVRRILEEENRSRTAFPVVLDRIGFLKLMMHITQHSINHISPEWTAAKELALNESQPGSSLVSTTSCQDVRCTCRIKTQLLLPCRHYLLPFARANIPIPSEMVHPQWWLDGPPFVTAWEPGLGLTASERNPAAVDPILLSTGLNNGQLVLERTALQQESFRPNLAIEDAQRFAQACSSEASTARHQFQPTVIPGAQLKFPPPGGSGTKQRKPHGPSKACGMTKRELAEQDLRRSTRNKKRSAAPAAQPVKKRKLQAVPIEDEILECIVLRPRV
ncbi:hypothetical protein K440DRAFT_642166 [Wilcoxina mikolae CBS 423.85]|nr:hypothetical protein K440DRAFT_642166 [Wilcoxina mikolae CBS 423.85]